MMGLSADHMCLLARSAREAYPPLAFSYSAIQLGLTYDWRAARADLFLRAMCYVYMWPELNLEQDTHHHHQHGRVRIELSDDWTAL